MAMVTVTAEMFQISLFHHRIFKMLQTFQVNQVISKTVMGNSSNHIKAIGIHRIHLVTVVLEDIIIKGGAAVVEAALVTINVSFRFYH